MKLYFIAFVIMLSSFCFSDVTTKIKIRHADPALIFMLLRGTVNPWLQPEFSSIVGGGFNSGIGGGSNASGSGFGGGSHGSVGK